MPAWHINNTNTNTGCKKKISHVSRNQTYKFPFNYERTVNVEPAGESKY